MPDLISVIERRWKWMLMLTLLATAGAFLACLLSPKKYLSIVTALPSNSVLNDKARIFNQNIEALYPEFGSPDELDKIEGTAKLDTIFLAAAKEFNLPAHYSLQTGNVIYKAALRLRKNTRINKTGFGELKIQVWDKDRQMAASLANSLLQKLNDIHQQLQMANNLSILQRLREEYKVKAQTLSGTAATGTVLQKDTISLPGTEAMLKEELTQYAKLINEYNLAVKTSPKILLVVEPARPSPEADKPKTLQTVALAFLASLLFSFLLAVFAESRSKSA